MAATQAVKIALEILHVPSRVKAVLAAPLPDGVDLLLAIAAGDRNGLASAALATERPEATIRDAAKFFIEQILLSAHADSYRVLGATQNTTPADLRRNMAYLVKWLHPDAGLILDRPAITGRVNQAWDDLKTPDRRTAYDATHADRLKSGRRLAAKKRRFKPQPPVRTGVQRDAMANQPPRAGAGSRLRRALSMLLGRDVR